GIGAYSRECWYQAYQYQQRLKDETHSLPPLRVPEGRPMLTIAAEGSSTQVTAWIGTVRWKGSRSNCDRRVARAGRHCGWQRTGVRALRTPPRNSRRFRGSDASSENLGVGIREVLIDHVICVKELTSEARVHS